MNATTPARSGAIHAGQVSGIAAGSSDVALPTGSWLQRRWIVAVYALRVLAVCAFIAAVALHPMVISRYVSSDGQLEEASRHLLYGLEALALVVGLAFLILAATSRKHTIVKERLVIGAAFALISIFACAAVMEGGLRVVHAMGRPLEASRHYFFSHDSLLGWRHRPGSVATFKNQRVSINAAGLRDDELAPEGTSNTFRILFLGDSQVFGDGVSHESTFVERLQRELPHVDAINGAVIGYGTDQQLLYFEREGAALRPGLTIVGLNAYDLRDNISKRVRSGYQKPVFDIRQGELALTNVPIDPGSVVDRAQSWLNNSSHLYATAARLTRGPADRGGEEDERTEPGTGRDPSAHTVFPPPGQIARALDVTRLMLKRLASDARTAGGRFAVMFLPYRMDFGGDTEYQAQADRVVVALKSWAASDGYPVLDLRDPLRTGAKTGAFLDAMHFSPEGHRVAAGAARDWLIASGLVPRQ
jgi:hypothetical protein